MVARDMKLFGDDSNTKSHLLLIISHKDFFYTLYYLFSNQLVNQSIGKFGSPYLGMPTAAARAALPSPTSAC